MKQNLRLKKLTSIITHICTAHPHFILTPFSVLHKMSIKRYLLQIQFWCLNILTLDTLSRPKILWLPFFWEKFCFIPWFYHSKNFSIQNNQATKKHQLIWHWYKVWGMKYELSILLQADTGPETCESWFSSLLIIGDFSKCVLKKNQSFQQQKYLQKIISTSCFFIHIWEFTSWSKCVILKGKIVTNINHVGD